MTPALGRFSILALYNRLFSVHDRFRIGVRVCLVINALWLISCIIAWGALCVPIESFWNRRVKGKCYQIATFVIAAEIPESVLDFVIVALPVGILRGLRLPKRQKVPLIFVFIFASLWVLVFTTRELLLTSPSVGVIGCIRIAITYRPEHCRYSTIAINNIVG